MSTEAAPIDAQAPADTTTVDTGASTAPTPIQLSDDSLVMLPGQSKALKYGDYIRGFQGEYTKTAQRAAELERKSEEYRGQLEQLRQQAQNPQTQQPGLRQALIQKLKSQSYLSGAEAAEAVDSILGHQEENQGLVVQAVRLLAQKLASVDKTLAGLNETHQTSSFESKISSALKANGMSPKFAQFAKNVYLAYEPSEALDREFPQILKEEYDAFKAAQQDTDKERIEAVRSSRFPGKGSPASAPKFTADFNKKSSRDQAGDIWDQMVKPEIGT